MLNESTCFPSMSRLLRSARPRLRRFVRGRMRECVVLVRPEWEGLGTMINRIGCRLRETKDITGSQEQNCTVVDMVVGVGREDAELEAGRERVDLGGENSRRQTM